ncbi:DUF554 domain-containing protein [Anaerotalea alkaliphila]|uniref:DUF554 domain-containing protein n=1 Tax=Anaerotalea alkaliphila TaxID=2662126 RepID=A0A7X5HWI4_9FIRM|nr:DUF554 domain-containing protein [Anaerotalea alkaliphila]NDL67766.1 DUF554 domain-containing protein [Anaerotalea alkaliphila]
MIGTFVNVGTVVAGSLIGLLLHARLSERVTKIAFQAIGLFTLMLGLQMALQVQNVLVMIFALIIGSVSGELLDVEAGFNKAGDQVKRIFKSSHDRFTEGIVTAFLLFCMGSLTILGAIQEGTGHAPTLLLTKSIMDGFASIALSSTLGIGVLFSAIPLLVYQGGLTLFAGLLENVLDEAFIQEVVACGGILLMGLGFNLLEIKRIKVANMLPSLLVVVLLLVLTGFFQGA